MASTLTRADGSPVRVLVVDDEANIAELLSMALRFEGWDVQRRHRPHGRAPPPASSARRGRARHDAARLSTASRCCAGCAPTPPTLPVLFLTAKDAVEDRIAGLTAGGDDYVTKPFSLEEVSRGCAR